jgi:hypothetical protein
LPIGEKSQLISHWHRLTWAQHEGTQANKTQRARKRRSASKLTDYYIQAKRKAALEKWEAGQ